LAPGEVIVTTEALCITTVLGSCVAVCLSAEETTMAAICHSVLPDSNAADKASSGRLRFVDEALEEMLAHFLRAGCPRESIRAKIFGGANVLKQSGSDHPFKVGERNVEAAEAWLAKHQIPIDARDVGGNHGRKLHFHSGCGEVLIRMVGSGAA
jgi:chemotaxis protein CheD